MARKDEKRDQTSRSPKYRGPEMMLYMADEGCGDGVGGGQGGVETAEMMATEAVMRVQVALFSGSGSD